MPELLPQRANSIEDVVAPSNFDSVKLWLELPKDATSKELDFYRTMSNAPASRAGGGNYPKLDMEMEREVYEHFLEDIKKNPRLVHSVIYQSNPKGESRFPNIVEAYLLQGAEIFKYLLI